MQAAATERRSSDATPKRPTFVVSGAPTGTVSVSVIRAQFIDSHGPPDLPVRPAHQFDPARRPCAPLSADTTFVIQPFFYFFGRCWLGPLVHQTLLFHPGPMPGTFSVYLFYASTLMKKVELLPIFLKNAQTTYLLPTTSESVCKFDTKFYLFFPHPPEVFFLGSTHQPEVRSKGAPTRA